MLKVPEIRLLLVEINRFVLVAGDAGANLRGGPSGLGFVVGVEAFLGAGGALGAVGVFIATVQAGVSERAIATAVARKLIDDTTGLGRQLVHPHLPVIAEIRPGQLSPVENGRHGLDIERG